MLQVKIGIADNFFSPRLDRHSCIINELNILLIVQILWFVL